MTDADQPLDAPAAVDPDPAAAEPSTSPSSAAPNSTPAQLAALLATALADVKSLRAELVATRAKAERSERLRATFTRVAASTEQDAPSNQESPDSAQPTLPTFTLALLANLDERTAAAEAARARRRGRPPRRPLLRLGPALLVPRRRRGPRCRRARGVRAHRQGGRWSAHPRRRALHRLRQQRRTTGLAGVGGWRIGAVHAALYGGAREEAPRDACVPAAACAVRLYLGERRQSEWSRGGPPPPERRLLSVQKQRGEDYAEYPYPNAPSRQTTLPYPSYLRRDRERSPSTASDDIDAILLAASMNGSPSHHHPPPSAQQGRSPEWTRGAQPERAGSVSVPAQVGKKGKDLHSQPTQTFAYPRPPSPPPRTAPPHHPLLTPPPPLSPPPPPASPSQPQPPPAPSPPRTPSTNASAANAGSPAATKRENASRSGARARSAIGAGRDEACRAEGDAGGAAGGSAAAAAGASTRQGRRTARRYVPRAAPDSTRSAARAAADAGVQRAGELAPLLASLAPARGPSTSTSAPYARAHRARLHHVLLVCLRRARARGGERHEHEHQRARDQTADGAAHAAAAWAAPAAAHALAVTDGRGWGGRRRGG